MRTLKEMIVNTQKVRFSFYREIGGLCGRLRRTRWGSPCIAFALAHFQHGQPASASVRKAHGKE